MATRYTVVIPALNEAARIGRTIHSARAAFGAEVDIFVVDGGSIDATCVRAAEAGATIVRSGKGRGRQLQAGIDAAKGDVLIMLHADTLLPAGAATAITAAIADETVAGGAFRVRFDREAGRLPPVLYLLEPFINLRSRVFRTATGDQAIFARRSAIKRAGGVPDLPLFEDVRFYRALRRTGRVVLLRETVTTSPRLWMHAGPVRVILLHLAFRALHAIGVSPHTLARWYSSLSRS